MNKFTKYFLLVIVLFTMMVSGCATQSRIVNVELDDEVINEPYTQINFQKPNNDIRIFLSFSGGGTRAAAFSYGVLETLRDTGINYENIDRSLLSEVDVISSVSGGSFTAAYYGLFGEQIFQHYEWDFLKQDVQKTLVSGLFNPFNWFKFAGSGFDRSELAIDYYDKHIFKQATFADFRKDMPFIQINATDLSSGQSFIFKQEYFNLLCSDIARFRVARAVAASSAVPVAFAPIVLENHQGCEQIEAIENRIQADADDNLRTRTMKQALTRYLDKDKVQYVHLVDGGIADNLGVRVLYDTVNIVGGATELSQTLSSKPPKYIVLILVNAAVSPQKRMDTIAEEPNLSEQIDAVSSAQIKRYSTESIELLKDSLKLWSAELSQSAGHEVKSYFIQIDFDGIQDQQRKTWFNKLSTSLALPAEQVDGLREAARRLLKQSPEFQRFLADIIKP